MSLLEREKPSLSKEDQERFMSRKDFVESKRMQRAIDTASLDYGEEKTIEYVHPPNPTNPKPVKL